MRFSKLHSLFFLIIIGCSTTQVHRGKCVEISEKICDRAIRWGYEARLVQGEFNGKGHQWVEYYYKGKWRVWDDAIWYVGKSWYTAKEMGYKECQ